MTVLCENGNITDAATKTAGIYYWRNNINGKGYVGKSLNLLKRLGQYIGMQFKAQTTFYAAVKKYGLENFTCYKVMDCCPSDVALNYWETYWIRELDTFIDGGHGYNLTTGGEGGKKSVETRKKIGDAKRGKKREPFSAEHCQKMSDAKRGKKLPQFSDEHRKKLSAAKRGKKLPPFSAEHRQKISDVQRGKTLSAETKRKMREAWAIRKKSKMVQSETLYRQFFVF